MGSDIIINTHCFTVEGDCVIMLEDVIGWQAQLLMRILLWMFMTD